VFATVILAAVLAAPAFQAEPAVKNPTIAEFVCPDHDRDDQHELTIYQNTAAGVAITTILLGDPVADPATGLIRVSINVQPIEFGSYYARLVAVAGGLKSDPSVASNVFERVPGAPSKPGIR
jgi:hypothetical protein